MLMPETPMNKNHFVPCSKHQIGFAGQALDVEAVSVTQAIDESADYHFRARAFATNPPHVFAAAGSRYSVHKSGWGFTRSFCVFKRFVRKLALEPSQDFELIGARRAPNLNEQLLKRGAIKC